MWQSITCYSAAGTAAGFSSNPEKDERMDGWKTNHHLYTSHPQKGVLTQKTPNNFIGNIINHSKYIFCCTTLDILSIMCCDLYITSVSDRSSLLFLPSSSTVPPCTASCFPQCSASITTKMADAMEEYEKEAGCVPILHPEVWSLGFTPSDEHMNAK